jgi:hypothetical protein
MASFPYILNYNVNYTKGMQFEAKMSASNAEDY